MVQSSRGPSHEPRLVPTRGIGPVQGAWSQGYCQAQIMVHPIECMKGLWLSSDPQKHRRPRLRINFSHEPKQRGNRAPAGSRLTQDEILESLTRRTHPEAVREAGVTDSEELGLSGTPSQLRGSKVRLPVSTPKKGRSLRALAFPLILVDTLLFVSLVGSVTRAYDVTLLYPFLGRLGIQPFVANTPLIGVIIVIVLLAALWISRK
jgi:hypothetical protein